MTGKSFRGNIHCYVCDSELNWHCPADLKPGSCDADSKTDADIQADIFAVGKDADGAVRFEVVCTCPACQTANKFNISAKMI